MMAQLSDLAPEGGYARLAHTTQYIERETPPTATSTSAESSRFVIPTPELPSDLELLYNTDT